MSSDQPHLRVSHTTNATSFKRSFEQFGFDLDGPAGNSDAATSNVGGSNEPSASATASASANNSNERHKRARSDSFSSDSIGTSGSSQRLTASSSRLTSGSSYSSDALPPLSTRPTHCPPFPPAVQTSPSSQSSHSDAYRSVPDMLDVEMSDASRMDDFHAQSPTRWSPSSMPPMSSDEISEQFRLSMERFNAFDTQISTIRHSHPVSSSSRPLSPSHNLDLPPLVLSSPESETTLPPVQEMQAQLGLSDRIEHDSEDSSDPDAHDTAEFYFTPENSVRGFNGSPTTEENGSHCTSHPPACVCS